MISLPRILYLFIPFDGTNRENYYTMENSLYKIKNITENEEDYLITSYNHHQNWKIKIIKNIGYIEKIGLNDK